MTKEKLVDHVVTEEDLKNDPDLVDLGIKVGETVQYPEGDVPKDNTEEVKEEPVEEEVQEVKAEPKGKDGKPLPSWMVA